MFKWLINLYNKYFVKKIEEKIFTVKRNGKFICKLKMPANITEEIAKDILFNSWRYKSYFGKLNLLHIVINEDNINFVYKTMPRNLVENKIYDSTLMDKFISTGEIEIPPVQAATVGYINVCTIQNVTYLKRQTTFITDTNLNDKPTQSVYTKDFTLNPSIEFITYTDEELKNG